MGMFWKLKVWNKLLAVEALLNQVLEREKHMSKVVDDLAAEVAGLKSVIVSAETLLTKLFALVQGAIDTGDITKVQVVIDDLKAQKAELAASVEANTPPATP